MRMKMFTKKVVLLLLVSFIVFGPTGFFGLVTTGPVLAAGISPKKGVASSYYANNDLSKITAFNGGWFYNWASTYSADSSKIGNLEYVPMLWGASSVTTANLDALRQGKNSGKFKNLLAFNEPDLASQSNMTVQQCIDLWPLLMNTGLRLGSPATTTPTNGWLDNFMNAANSRSYRVDFIALHFYPDFTDPNSIDDLRNKITAVYNKHQKPIWITEIGTVDINAWGIPTKAVPTQYAADEYMKKVIPMLEGLSYVERYAWFTDRCYDNQVTKYSSLYDVSGNLTNMGRIYQGYSPYATFYADINYGGTAKSLPLGTYTMAQMNAAGIPNDWMSSLKVPKGYTVEVYQHDNFTGTKWTFTSDSSWVGSAVNDQMTSVKVLAAGFYQDVDYGGISVALSKGNYTMAQMNAAGIPNDWISSLKVPNGWTVELYQHDNFTGTKWTFTANSNWVGAAINDQATSIKIY